MTDNSPLRLEPFLTKDIVVFRVVGKPEDYSDLVVPSHIKLEANKVYVLLVQWDRQVIKATPMVNWASSEYYIRGQIAAFGRRVKSTQGDPKKQVCVKLDVGYETTYGATDPPKINGILDFGSKPRKTGNIPI